MIITLQLSDGRKMSFSKEELIVIVEEHLKKMETTAVENKLPKEEWFNVEPLTIDQNLFKEKRKDSRQEKIRRLICGAFKEMKKNPQYQAPFKTTVPQSKCTSKTIAEFKRFAAEIGDHNANWVEQALEWAQKISNGETWEDICNKKDTSSFRRVVIWKDGYAHFVGCSSLTGLDLPATCVSTYGYFDDYYYNFENLAPLVVAYI